MKVISASVVALAIGCILLSMSVPLAARLNKEFVVGGDQHWRFGFDNPDDYLSCNVGKAKVLANETQGADEGFKHRLPNTNIQYFASGINNGFQCKKGNMKFSVWPTPY
uniref:Phytocyanin domain-containing protein n=1 Tax=Ananas comosus var. bracteatus TaxID=296719 RepID=A0A6V7QS40_ANACO